MHNVPGGKVVALRPDQTSTEVKALVGFLSPPLTYDRRDVRAQKELVAAALDGVGWETERVLADMWSSPGFFFDSISQVHLDRWSNGRVVLLGDAGWCPSPLSGLGTGLAARGCLRASPRNWPPPTAPAPRSPATRSSCGPTSARDSSSHPVG
jgi:hypothetical protein